MIAAVAALMLGVGMPWLVFRERDQELGRPRALGRGEFALWFLVCLAIVMGTLGLGLLVPAAPRPHANSFALAASLACLASRRLRDLNASPWWAVLGLVWPVALAGHVILMLLPGRRGAAGPASQC